jgi:RHS repeat-associated protein
VAGTSGPYRYAGQAGAYQDAETGLVLMGYRYYDPSTGRFLTKDPIGFAVRINQYAYAGNDPVNFMDPYGLSPWSDAADWYMGGMGGFSDFVDRYMMGGTAAGFGDAWGNYDVGCASAGDVAWAGTKAFGMGLSYAIPAARVADAALADAVAAGACFTAGTPVQMADGTTKPIEEVKAGDLVQTKDPQSGKVSAGKVTQTLVHQAPATVALTFSTGEVIECTPEHPFYVEGVGFTPAGQLGIGTSIVTRAGPAVQVAKVERHDKPATVYNFTVEGTHTYFVGKSGLWVHNTCQIPWITPGSLAAEEEQGIVDTLGHIDNETTPSWAGRNWNTPFKNHGGDLPGVPGAGGYTEFNVPNAPGSSGIGLRRIVVGPDGTYYSWTHYGDAGSPPFVRIR